MAIESLRKRRKQLFHLCRQNGFFIVIYFTTFLVVLPLLCGKLGYSTYFVAPKEPYKILDAQNEVRTNKAKDILDNFKQSAAFPLRSFDQARQIEFSIVLLTAYRTSKTHYLLQVTARLLPQVASDEGKSVVTILNSDSQSGHNQDALYLSHFLSVVNSSSSSSSTISQVSREKEDYVVGLETALQHNSTYVLMIEDDALPSENLLRDLRFVLKNIMPWKFSKTGNDWAFLKLYYPEKWQGFGWPEVPEIVFFGVLGGCFGVLLDSKVRSRTRSRKPPMLYTFIVWAVYFVLVVYTVGRAHLIELRKLCPFMYAVVRAPGCCTPGVLYQRSHARGLANFLKLVDCNEMYPMDVAIDDFATKSRLERYLVMPNMVSHIGVHSSLSSRLKHFKEFFLMFSP